MSFKNIHKRERERKKLSEVRNKQRQAHKLFEFFIVFPPRSMTSFLRMTEEGTRKLLELFLISTQNPSLPRQRDAESSTQQLTFVAACSLSAQLWKRMFNVVKKVGVVVNYREHKRKRENEQLHSREDSSTKLSFSPFHLMEFQRAVSNVQ